MQVESLDQQAIMEAMLPHHNPTNAIPTGLNDSFSSDTAAPSSPHHDEVSAYSNNFEVFLMKMKNEVFFNDVFLFKKQCFLSIKNKNVFFLTVFLI